MYFNLRRVGVQGEISKMRQRATTRARLVNAKAVELSILSLGDVLFRYFSTLGYWFITFICNRLNHACAAVTSLFIGLSPIQKIGRISTGQ